MAATPETGFLVIADLSGYTAYLSRGELEHAPVIAGDLLEAIVGRLEPPFRLTKFEGDAAFLFVEDGRADASLLLDAIEASYVAFRRRLRSIEGATACNCNACGLAPQLDLKFFLHHGRYVRGRIAGRDELAGSSVILVHRLLKGTSVAAARPGGFALATQDAIDALGVDPASLSMTRSVESMDQLGDVTTHVLDLETRWQAESAKPRLTVEHGEPVLDLEVVVRADPAVVWAHLTAPALRPAWEGPIVITESPIDGWRGVGTMARCVTDRLATIEEIVDWQPYDHVGYRLVVADVGPVDATYDLAASGERTTVRLRWAIGGVDAPRSAGADQTGTIERIAAEKRSALDRLALVVGDVSEPSGVREPGTAANSPRGLDIGTAPGFAAL
jgi:uncharacterized protein YndB with AHSA1/START domain